MGKGYPSIHCTSTGRSWVARQTTDVITNHGSTEVNEKRKRKKECETQELKRKKIDAPQHRSIVTNQIWMKHSKKQSPKSTISILCLLAMRSISCLYKYSSPHRSLPHSLLPLLLASLSVPLCPASYSCRDCPKPESGPTRLARAPTRSSHSPKSCWVERVGESMAVVNPAACAIGRKGERGEGHAFCRGLGLCHATTGLPSHLPRPP